MKFSYLATMAIHTVERIPTLVWAAWILGVVVGTAILALRTVPIG